MKSLFTLKGYLGTVQTVYYDYIMLSRYLSTGIIELLALIAPFFVYQHRSGGTLNTFSTFNLFNNGFNSNEESVSIETLEL